MKKITSKGIAASLGNIKHLGEKIVTQKAGRFINSDLEKICTYWFKNYTIKIKFLKKLKSTYQCHNIKNTFLLTEI